MNAQTPPCTCNVIPRENVAQQRRHAGSAAVSAASGLFADVCF